MKTVSKFDTFINYCNTNMRDKKLRKLIFENERDVEEGFYNYRPMYKTHGHWIVQVDFAYFKYNKKFYSIGFQYQDETCKINCMEAGELYWLSNPEDIYDFIDIFKKIAPMDYRLNRPKTRCYVSISKKYRGISNLSDGEFSKELYLKMIDAKTIIDELINTLKQKQYKGDFHFWGEQDY